MGFLNRIQEIWKGFSSTKKSVSLVIIACLLLSTYFFYRWATKVEYAPLFNNVDTDNAARIVEGLKEINVPYILTDSGKTILIPEEQVYEVRLNLAGKGLVSEGGKGFELFDESNLGATDFERSINYQRALQEELRRTIVHIEAVKQARVHLVLPAKSAFIENQHKPQASIVLELKPLLSLEPNQVQGIAELVAGSVEGLSIENVNIVDTTGRVLSDSIKNSASNQMNIANFVDGRAFEENLEKRIQHLLESVYGLNKVVTMVTADLDFNQKETNSTVWGNEGVIASEQTNQRMTDISGSSGLVGDPLTDPEAVAIPGAEQYSDISTTRNYEINQVVEREIQAPGQVKSISVAVVINGDLSPEEKVEIQDIVSAAIGFDAERGDTISILSTTFDQHDLEQIRAEMAKAEAQDKEQEQRDKLVSWGLKGVGMVALFIIALVLIRNRKVTQEPWPELNMEPVLLKKVEEQVEQAEQSSRFISEDVKIKNIIKDEPEVAVQIINSWLEESGSDKNG